MKISIQNRSLILYS